ncbi:MAG: hypothetical protein JW956_10440 [Calditrichaceae bacterium]|nr:hypothetical protein [Calditrichaceae bacterium]
MLIIKKIKTLLLILTTFGIVQAQFLDSFDQDKIDSWFFFTGDGSATMDFIQKDDYARILVDATQDKHNVWWAIIKRDVSPFLDLEKLKDPSYELRVEARVRLSHAPRRINFMLNTQRTTNFHEHLMEYDISDTTHWHTISYLTKNFDAVPGDTVYVQLGVTDWGWGKYQVDLDYYRAEVVNVNNAEYNKGELIPYHPPIPDVGTFSNHLNVAHDALINMDFPNINFNNWHIKNQKGEIKILTINANQWAILRWDFDQYKNAKIEEAGLLELTTFSVPIGGDYAGTYGEDFGMEFNKIRVIEVIGGKSEWDQNKVTYNNFMQDKPYSEIFNTQMIYDAEVLEQSADKNFITISRPVLQRLIDGRTKGLLIRPLGAINPSFYASENNAENSPKLHFNIAK